MLILLVSSITITGCSHLRQELPGKPEPKTKRNSQKLATSSQLLQTKNHKIMLN